MMNRKIFDLDERTAQWAVKIAQNASKYHDRVEQLAVVAEERAATDKKTEPPDSLQLTAAVKTKRMNSSAREHAIAHIHSICIQVCYSGF